MKRQSNYELMRIISMFLIVLWHVIAHAQLQIVTSGSARFLITCLYIIIYLHVNSFVLVTGYFQCEKKRKWKKVVQLLGLVLFYKVLFIIVFSLIGLETASPKELIDEIIFFKNSDYWFINIYLLLYIFSPYLNILISKLTKKQHQKLILLLGIVFSVIPFLTNQQCIANNGTTLIQFVFLYLIGAYFHFYPLKESYHFKRMKKKNYQWLMMSGILFFGLLNILLYFFGNSMQGYQNSVLTEIGKALSNGIMQYSNPILILQSIFYFLFFGTLTLQKSWIDKISSCTLGIYIIHENRHIYNLYLSQTGWDSFSFLSGIGVFVKLIVVACLLFVFSLLLEFIRKKIVKFFLSRKFINKWKEKWHNNIKNRERRNLYEAKTAK